MELEKEGDGRVAGRGITGCVAEIDDVGESVRMEKERVDSTERQGKFGRGVDTDVRAAGIRGSKSSPNLCPK